MNKVIGKLPTPRGLGSSSIADIRHKAYLETLKLYGLEINPAWVVYCKKVDRKEGDALASVLMALGMKPDAVFCLTMWLLGALAGVRNSGYKVPGDVGVLGFSNSDLAEVCSPQLSSINQPGKRIGKRSIQLVLNNINEC